MKDGDINVTIAQHHRVIRLIDPVTFVVPGTAVVEKFEVKLRRAPAQFHHCSKVNTNVLVKLSVAVTGETHALR